MKPSLLVLSGNYPPETGGPAKFVKSFSDWAVNKVSRVSVISTHPAKNISEKQGDININLVSRSQNILLRYFKTIKLIGANSDKNTFILANGCFFEILISSYIFDFKYCIKLPGDIVWERAKTNRETNLGMLDFQESKLSFKNWVLRFLFTLSLKRSQVVIVPSSIMYSVTQQWGIEASKIKLIFNAVNTDDFKPQPEIKKEFDIITVSRLISIKKIDELIKCAGALNMSLLVVGEGPLLDELENENTRFGSPATFFGPATQNELPGLYNQASYFVLNSEFEAGTPYSLLEARACGLVAVANIGTGARDVITNHVDGFLFKADSVFDLMQSMKKASDLSLEYKEYSMAAVADCKKRFSEEVIYKQILSLIENHE